MYNVLVVDDERIIREGLIKYIPWERYDMAVAASASNASAALALFKTQKIDVLVTDIKMPEKTGFELIDELSLNGYYPRIIIISSYDDFAYAQRACKLDMVCDYVLKPINSDDFEKTLERVREHLDTQASKDGEPADASDYRDLLALIELVGFTDEKYFTRVFKSAVGATPKQYQQSVNGAT